MRFLPRFGSYGSSPDKVEDSEPANAPGDENSAGVSSEPAMPEESGLLKTVGWISAALGAVALGLIVGREIRQRYRFNRRTPYDLYSHSGDELPDVDYSVGI